MQRRTCLYLLSSLALAPLAPARAATKSQTVNAIKAALGGLDNMLALPAPLGPPIEVSRYNADRTRIRRIIRRLNDVLKEANQYSAYQLQRAATKAIQSEKMASGVMRQMHAAAAQIIANI